jgi:hypothetical protein
MGRRLRQAGLCLLLSVPAWPAWALDPLLMFLLSVAKEVVVSASRQKPGVPVPVPAPPEVTRYPGTAVEPEALKRLIDECFGYLSASQRREVFDSLHATLMDPKNAAVRASMIDYFVSRAVAVREAQHRLAQLSAPEQDRLVAEFRSAVAALPPIEAEQLADLLRQGVLPVPNELGNKLLAAIDSR